MIKAFDRPSMGRLLAMPLTKGLHYLLSQRTTSLITVDGDLTDWTEFLIVERGDREDDIVREVGFSPLVDPINGTRYGQPTFEPHWDWLGRQDGWFELIVSFGSTFAYVLFIEDHPDADPELLSLCREFAE